MSVEVLDISYFGGQLVQSVASVCIYSFQMVTVVQSMHLFEA